MSKNKKKKSNLEKCIQKLALQAFLNGAPDVRKEAIGVSSAPLNVIKQKEPLGGLDDVVVEQKRMNYVTEQVLEEFAPYMIEQSKEVEHNRKKRKSIKRKLRRIEAKIEQLERDQEHIIRALAYAAAIGDISYPNATALALEKDFKMKYKETKKLSRKGLNEIPL